MAKIWIVPEGPLPSPEPGASLVFWSVQNPPSGTVRSWSGWAETPVIAGQLGRDSCIAYTPDMREWRSSLLSVGQGRVWRFEERYLVWLHPDALHLPEIGRALALAGVVIVVVVGDAPCDVGYLDPLWRTVQANQIFGIRVSGTPRLYMPCELDPQEDGTVVLERYAGGYAVDLPLEELAAVRRSFPIHQGLRPDLYRQERWWTE